jgi:hypothetical protein
MTMGWPNDGVGAEVQDERIQDRIVDKI